MNQMLVLFPGIENSVHSFAGEHVHNGERRGAGIFIYHAAVHRKDVSCRLKKETVRFFGRFGRTKKEQNYKL